jgi:hypothetical protein
MWPWLILAILFRTFICFFLLPMIFKLFGFAKHTLAPPIFCNGWVYSQGRSSFIPPVSAWNRFRLRCDEIDYPTGILSDWNKFRGQNITIFIEKTVHIINSRNAYNICFSKKDYYGVVHNELSKGTNIRRNKFKFKFKFFINKEGSIRNKCFIVVHFLCFKKGINFSSDKNVH